MRHLDPGMAVASLAVAVLMACGGGPEDAAPVGAAPAEATAAVHVFVAGDSTVSTYVNSPIHQAGWGQYLGSYFTSTVVVDNRAIGGRTSRRFIEEGRLASILSSMVAGDYLFVQFGTNDSNKTAVYADGEPYYLAPQTDFKRYLQQYIDGARAKGGTPVLVTPPPRNTCTNGLFGYGPGAYATAMKELGQANGVPVIDLGQKTITFLQSKNSCAWASANFFLVRADGTVDGTHFQENGARLMAGFVADGVAELKLPLAAQLLNAPTPSTYTLTLAVSGPGTTDPSPGAHGYAAGTVVTITATPASGAGFTGWSGAVSGTGNPVTVTMDGNKAVSAAFATTSSGGPCSSPITMTGGQSGSFNTTGAVCLRTSATVNGWGCANFQGRTVSVNGGAAGGTCGAGPFPMAKYSDGYTYFAISGGTYTWASLYYW